EAESCVGEEALVRVGAVDAPPEDARPRLAILRGVTLEVVRLEGAAAGEVLGVEVENDPLPPLILQARLMAVAGREAEVRRRAADRRKGRSGRSGRRGQSRRETCQKGQGRDRVHSHG